MNMCGNCGVNHETRKLEDQDTFDAFLARVLDGIEPDIVDYMEEYQTEADVTLSGEDWEIRVAKVGGTSDVHKEYAVGEQWIVNQYEDGDLVDSIVIRAIKPKSTQQAAEEFAAGFYGYTA